MTEIVEGRPYALPMADAPVPRPRPYHSSRGSDRCPSCQGPLPESLGNRPRKWCSDTCRKRGVPSHCTRCGAACRAASTYCNSCKGPATASHVAASHEAQRQYLIRRWREGATGRQIAEELGLSVQTIHCKVTRLRARGVDLPYRYVRR
jgi:hypothetical protein